MRTDTKPRFKFFSRSNPTLLTFIASVLFAVAYNGSFWSQFIKFTGGMRWSNLPLFLASFLALVLLVNALLTLLTFRMLFKPVMTLLFCLTALAAYFMSHYGTVIDSTMIQNVMETNPREALELFNWPLLGYFLVLGVVPSIFVWRTKLKNPVLWRDVLIRIGVIVLSLIVALGLMLAFFKTLAPTFREHRQLQLMLTPFNYISATSNYINRKLARPVAVAPLGTDAARGAYWKDRTRRAVTVIVLGETARAKNFSLNGYPRNTNPELSKQAGLVNFSNVQSCGTATAVSVPCVFSSLGRKNYSDSKAKSQQGLLDVLAHADFDVLWRDNNSGCKGVCDRVQYEDMSKPVAGNPACNSEECRDERMLDGLPERIKSSKKDMVIVLHQMGSHGPTYYKRYPDRLQTL